MFGVLVDIITQKILRGFQRIFRGKKGENARNRSVKFRIKDDSSVIQMCFRKNVYSFSNEDTYKYFKEDNLPSSFYKSLFSHL